MLPTDMRHFRATLRRHRTYASLVLALFLGGTNYCVAVAIAGPDSRLACGMMAAAKSPDANAAVPSCHAPAGAAASDPAAQPVTGPMPCCITLAPSASAPDAKPTFEIAEALPSAAGLLEAPLPAWREAPEELDTGPPERLAPSSLSSRAPPLA